MFDPTASDTSPYSDSTDFDLKTQKKELYLKDDKFYLRAEFLDQDGKQFIINDDTLVSPSQVGVSYRSATPLIAMIHEGTGKITPIKVGTAQFVVTFKEGTKKISKTFAVSVKANPVPTKLEILTNDSSLVIGSGIDKDFYVIVYDQYDNVYVGEPATMTAKINKNGVANNLNKTTSLTNSVTSGMAAFTVEPLADGNAETGVITFEYGTLKATYSLKSVKKATFKKYVAVANSLTIDMHDRDLTDERYVGPTEAVVEVFAQDVNGNYIRRVPFDDSTAPEEYAELELVPVVPAINTALEYDASDSDTLNPIKVGKQKAKVHVKGNVVDPIVIDTIEFTVVDSIERLTTVKQTVDSVKAGTTDQLKARLLSIHDGTRFVPAAFLGYNQYGDRIDIEDSDVTKVWSSNPSVVPNSDAGNIGIGEDGTANVTLRIAGKDFNIDVNVVND